MPACPSSSAFSPALIIRRASGLCLSLIHIYLVTVNGGGSSEYTGKVEVEYLFLLVGELHVDVAHRSGDGVQHFFPLCPPFQETGVIVDVYKRQIV